MGRTFDPTKLHLRDTIEVEERRHGMTYPKPFNLDGGIHAK